MINYVIFVERLSIRRIGKSLWGVESYWCLVMKIEIDEELVGDQEIKLISMKNFLDGERFKVQERKDN